MRRSGFVSPDVAELVCAIVREPDVARLEIAVDDLLGMGVLQRLQHGVGDTERLVRLPPAAAWSIVYAIE